MGVAEKTETVRCPYCAEEIQPDARKCRHCGEWLDRRAQHVEEIPAGPAVPAQPVTRRAETGIRYRLRRGTKLRKAVITVAALVLLCLVLAGIALALGLHFYTYKGESMTPALKDGQTVVTETLSYDFGSPERGDVVAFWATPAGLPNSIFIKRIIGLPGETVAVHDQGVYINGQRLNEPYIQPRYRAAYTLSTQKVPPDHYFVLGDNRNNSQDSHIWGMLPRKYITGKVWFSW